MTGININPVLLTLNLGEWGRVYQDYLWDLSDFVEPAPTGFFECRGGFARIFVNNNKSK